MMKNDKINLEEKSIANIALIYFSIPDRLRLKDGSRTTDFLSVFFFVMVFV